VHEDALNTLGIEIAAVCDPVSEKTARFDCAKYEGFEEMLEMGGFDVMHICLPHFLHAPAAIYAMERGVHVLSEKPMATVVADAKEMIATAAAQDVTLGVIFQNRYNTASQLVKSALVSGKLGKVKSGWLKVTWHRDEKYYTESAWRGRWSTEGGGALINQSIHTFDLANYFIGTRPSAVEASIANRAHPSIEVEDVAEGIISYGDIKISFFASTIHPYDAPVELELICENGRASIAGATAVIEYTDGTTETANQEDSAIGKSYWGSSHIRQIEAFYASLSRGEKPEIDGEEAIKTQRLICGIYDSAKSGKRVDLT